MINKKSSKFSFLALLMAFSIIFSDCYTSDNNEKKVLELFLNKTITISNDDKWIITNINKMSEFTNEERFLKLRS